MKSKIALILLTLLLGLACKKKSQSQANDPGTKPASPAGTDSTSSAPLSINGVPVIVSDTVYRTFGNPSTVYRWSGRDANTDWNIFITFSGMVTPVPCSYTIGTSCILQLTGYQKNTGISTAQGAAGSGSLTVTTGSPGAVSFTNIVAQDTQSNTVNYTISGSLPMWP